MFLCFAFKHFSVLGDEDFKYKRLLSCAFHRRPPSSLHLSAFQHPAIYSCERGYLFYVLSLATLSPGGYIFLFD